MTPHDDEFLDLVAVLALGALPEAEAREVIAHLRTCDECRALYAELRPAADLIGYASDPAATDEIASKRMKARVMGAARADAAVIAGDEARPAAKGSRASFLPWYAAVAAVVIAALIGADDLSFRTRADRTATAQRSQIAVLGIEKRAGDARVSVLLAPGSKHFSIPQGEIVTKNRRLFIAMRLPAPPSGKIYQAWTLAKGSKTISPSVTFSPASNGVAIVELPINAEGLAAVAVSVEPTGGSKAPTSTPKFIRKLS